MSDSLLRQQYDELEADNGRLLNRLAVAEAQVAEVDAALIACQERCNELEQHLTAERERNAPLRARIKGIQDQHDREMAPLRKRLDDRTRAAEFRRQMIREWYRRYRKVESERAWAKARERRLAEAARPIAAYLSETDRLAGLKRSEVRELIAALAEHDAAKGE